MPSWFRPAVAAACFHHWQIFIFFCFRTLEVQALIHKRCQGSDLKAKIWRKIPELTIFISTANSQRLGQAACRLIRLPSALAAALKLLNESTLATLINIKARDNAFSADTCYRIHSISADWRKRGTNGCKTLIYCVNPKAFPGNINNIITVSRRHRHPWNDAGLLA